MNEKVIDILRIWGPAGMLFACIATAPNTAAPSTAAPDIQTPSGAYLAGRHAQEKRDYAAAASWYEDALKTDPESPELISRTFLMEASEGRFDRARLLAEKELKLDPTDAVAELILLIDRVKAGDRISDRRERGTATHKSPRQIDESALARTGHSGSGSIPHRSFTADRSFCLHPR